MEDDQTRVAFVHVPKAAGGSIHQWLKVNSVKNNFTYLTGHFTLSELKQRNKEYHSDEKDFDFSFAVTRNTYDRLISNYVFANSKTRRMLSKSKKRNNPELIEYWQSILDSIDKGIVYFLEYSFEFDPRMTRTLKDWLIDVDIILTQENLKKDFKIIQEKLNCFKELPTWGHKMNYDAKEYYTNDFKKFVEKHYAEELEFFKYKPKY